jgi:dTDP-4-amino-4,6-dideoxygalactose transaminase
MSVAYPPSRIEVFRPSIGEEEIEAVAAVMRSGWIGRGPKVDEFEQAWARHIGVAPEHVVSVGCATEGLYQIMQHIRHRPYRNKPDIIIPDNSFIGTACAVLDNRMALKVCDIQSDTLNPRSIHYGDCDAEHAQAVVFQHYAGFEGNQKQIANLMRAWGVKLIEDFACHPMGKPVGDYAVWSFDAMKVLTCGDGGMVYCRDTQAAADIRQATRLGMDTATGQSNDAANWWEFTARTPGRRSIMNDIEAAIGLVQLERLPKLIAHRIDVWDTYQGELPDADWIVKPPEPAEWETSSYYTYWLALPSDGHRDRLAAYLRERGIYTTYRYYSVSRAYGWDVNCPNSQWASDHVLNLPLHPGLSDDDVSFICETIAEFGRTL